MGNQNNIIVGAASLKIDGIDVGFTQGGVSFRKQNDYVDVEADQLGGVARKVKTGERAFLTTTLAEATLRNLRLAMAEPSGNQYSGSALSLGQGTLTTQEHTITVTGKAPDGVTTRTYTFTRCIAVDEVEHLIGSRDTASTIPIGFELLKDPAYGDTFGRIIDT